MLVYLEGSQHDGVMKLDGRNYTLAYPDKLLPILQDDEVILWTIHDFRRPQLRSLS